MPKDGVQLDQKNIVHDGAVDYDKIDNLNKDEVHLHNGRGVNINDGNTKYNYIKQGGVINQQDGQENHVGGTNNKPQAQNENFIGVNELDQNSVDNKGNNNDDNNVKG